MTHAHKEYLEWERQATVLPILMCMEAWMEPSKIYFGSAWPATYIKYENDVVSWYTKMDGLQKYGQVILDQHLKEGGVEKFLKDVERIAKRMGEFFHELDGTDLSILGDAELVSRFSTIHELWIGWFVPGGVCEPVGIRGEQSVKTLLKGSKNPEKALSLLTTTTKKSFSRRELEELLRIAIEVKKGGRKEELLDEHAKKWFWLHNNYFKTEVLDATKFSSDLDVIFAKYPDPKKYLEELEESARETAREKEQMMQRLNFNKEQRRLIEILDIHAWYQDYRKEWTMIMLHYLDLALNEIAKKKELSLSDIKWLLADEIMLLFHDFDPKPIIEHRKKYAFFTWENNKFESCSGTEARKKETQVLKLIKSAKEIIEIPGSIANKGLVRGIARVTMSAEEAKRIQKGEILVTSMTSPDFISAIKKAAAIVTNEGGILCHAAIVSREFGIPCIVGTGIASKTIKDGDLIEVDGNHGFVRILKK